MGKSQSASGAVSKRSRKRKTRPVPGEAEVTKTTSASSKATKQHAARPVPNETPESLRFRVTEILQRLEEVYDGAFEGLNYSTPLELLVATMLSAQSTDKLVNTVTPALFRKYHTVQDYATVPIEELEQDIRSTGYYRAKARNLQACCRQLEQQFNSTVPGTMEELISLPGVGRKTANCLLSQVFGQQGLTVDTHVNRISNLLGFVHDTDAVRIEFALMDIVPKNQWNRFNELIITHGRKTCIARRPQCSRCAIADLCPSRQA